MFHAFLGDGGGTIVYRQYGGEGHAWLRGNTLRVWINRFINNGKATRAEFGGVGCLRVKEESDDGSM